MASVDVVISDVVHFSHPQTNGGGYGHKKTLAKALSERLEALEDTVITLVTAVADSQGRLNSPDIFRVKEAISDARYEFSQQISLD